MLSYTKHTLCRCHSLMFTVHFNKVRQTASNLLCFDLLPRQSIDLYKSRLSVVGDFQFSTGEGFVFLIRHGLLVGHND